MAVALAFKAECRTDAHPVVVKSFAVLLLHHVAEAVVGRARERAGGILAHLIRCLVENLLQTGHLLEVDIDLCQIGACRRAGMIGERAGLLVAPGVVGGGLIDGSACQVGKALGCRGQVVGGDDAGVGVVLRGLADSGLEGGLLPVVGQGLHVGELAHYVPPLLGFFQCLCGLLLLLFFC